MDIVKTLVFILFIGSCKAYQVIKEIINEPVSDVDTDKYLSSSVRSDGWRMKTVGIGEVCGAVVAGLTGP